MQFLWTNVLINCPVNVDLLRSSMSRSRLDLDLHFNVALT